MPSRSPSPSPSKKVSFLLDKVERLSERIVQVEKEKSAVQAEFQRQQALQHQALQQLHTDKSATEAVNEKLKNIIFDLHITIEENSSDLASLRVGEVAAKGEIDRLLEKCSVDSAAMTLVVAENKKLKSRIRTLQKSKIATKGLLKSENTSLNLTSKTYSELKSILNRKLHSDEESMLLTADRNTGSDREAGRDSDREADREASRDGEEGRDRDRGTAENGSDYSDADGYGEQKFAVSIPPYNLGSDSDAALRYQSNLTAREYKRALGASFLCSQSLLSSCNSTDLSGAHP
jgi:hypothetical protein